MSERVASAKPAPTPADGPVATTRLRLSAAAAWSAIAVLAACLGYFSLGHYNHNDHMYAVAPALALRLRPYVDFAYVQTPLSLMLYSTVLRVVGEADLYAALRILSLALHLLILAVGVLLCRRHAVHKDLAGLSLVGLYVAFRPDDIIGAEIGNYTLSLALAATALAVRDGFRGRAWTPLAVGLLAGLSVSAKLSYVYVALAFAGLVLLDEAALPRRLRRLGAYGLGGLVGVAPILVYLAQSPARFLFENVHFHYLSNLYRNVTPLGAVSDLSLFSVVSGFLALAALALAAALGWLAVRAVLRRTPRLRPALAAPTAFERDVLCVAAAAIIGAVTPGVVFQQYMAAPAFLLILFAVLRLDRLSPPPGRARISPLAAAAAAAVLLGGLQAADLVRETAIKQHDGVYALTAVPEARARLAAAIAAIDRASPGCHGDLVTAFGVPALGAGARLSPISSTGAFAMRLDPIFRRRAPAYRWMSDPSAYLTPRSLILSGFYAASSYEPYSPFEGVMDRYAGEHRFRAIPLGRYIYQPITLYAPPGCRAG